MVTKGDARSLDSKPLRGGYRGIQGRYEEFRRRELKRASTERGLLYWLLRGMLGV